MPAPAPRRTALVLLCLVLAGSGCGGSSGTADGADGGGDAGDAVTTTGEAGAQTATVGMNDKLAFVPTTVQAKVGTVALDVKNLGRVPHNLQFDDDALGRTGTIAGGEAEALGGHLRRGRAPSPSSAPSTRAWTARSSSAEWSSEQWWPRIGSRRCAETCSTSSCSCGPRCCSPSRATARASSSALLSFVGFLGGGVSERSSPRVPPRSRRWTGCRR